MIDKNALSQMTLSEVNDFLQRNEKSLHDLEENPELTIVTGISYNDSVADVFNEQAQLLRRMADIYDEFANERRNA